MLVLAVTKLTRIGQLSSFKRLICFVISLFVYLGTKPTYFVQEAGEIRDSFP